MFTNAARLCGETLAVAGQVETFMRSNFAAAKRCLEEAGSHLAGDDATSLHAKEAIELLLEAIITAEHLRSRKKAKVLLFPTLIEQS